MKLLIVFLFLPFVYFAQALPYGPYCKIGNDGMECLQIIDYGTHEGESNPPVSVRLEGMDYRAVFNKKKKCYEISYDQKVIYSFTVSSGEYPIIYWTKAGESDSEVYEFFPEIQEDYQDEEDSENDFQGIINGYIIDEDLSIDIELVTNPHHIQDVEYFNKDKNLNLPHELIFYDFINRQRINDMFVNADEIPAETKQKIIAIGEILNSSYEGKPFYMIFDETEELYHLFSSENVLLYKVKLLEDSKYLEFYSTTAKNLGKMRMLDMGSSDGVPTDILVIGPYHLEDGTELELRMKDDVNSEEMLVYYPTSKYGIEFIIIDELSDKQYCALPKDEKKYYYEIIFDENESGVFHLIDLKTKEKVTARYEF